MSLQNESYIHLEQGIKLVDAKLWADALVVLEYALELDPNLAIAWQKRGLTLRNLSRNDEALQSYKRAIELEPNFPDAYLGHGYTLNSLGRDEEAIASYDQALAIKPDYYLAWFDRGNALSNLGRDEEAIASYDRALAIKPDYHLAWHNRGVVLNNLGRDEEAIASYDQALAIKPDFWKTIDKRNSLINRIYSLNQRITFYEAEYLKAKNSNNLVLQAYVAKQISTYVKEEIKDEKLAYKFLFKASETAKHLNLSVYDEWFRELKKIYLQADVLFKTSKLEDTKKWIQTWLPIFKEVNDSYGLITFNIINGDIAVEENKNEEAIASYEQALAVKPDYYLAWYSRGNALNKLGRYEEAVAQMFSQQRDENRANWLRNLAMQLREALNQDKKVELQSLSEAEKQVYYQFLMQVLEATGDSRGNSLVVYPLLEKNIDKLNEVFKEVLHRWGTKFLEELKVDEAKYLYIVTIIVIFSNLIAQFPLGNKASNIEIAITGYKVALTVYSQQAFPDQWAMTQNNLATAYLDRIAGERSENLEQAITCFKEALKVYTFEASPYDWAKAQNSLGIAYSNRIVGERAENLEQAVACFKEALKVRTFEAFPDQWAMTQNNLATAYLDRIAGEISENLEQAITCFKEALKVYTFEASPYDWAKAQNNLGIAYSNRIRGQEAENFKQAITCLKEALKVRTFEAFPQDWAMTQNNLANAYISVFRKGQYQYLGQAITCLKEALKVRTFETFPYEWANTQNTLGIVHFYIDCLYRDIIGGEEAENFGQENLEQAIICFQETLKVHTFEAFPQDWAMTQSNLANTYGRKIKGNRAENLERAAVYSRETLKVYTFEAFPQKHTEGLINLGAIYQEAKRFDLAYATFTSVITKVEFLWSEIFSGEESKRKQAEHFHQCYGRIVEVCLELGNITEAIEYVERSKTQTLIEQILERDSKSIFPPEVVTQLEKYKYQIATEQYQIQNGKAKNLQSKIKHLQELRQHHNELQNRYLRVGAGFNFESFQATLDERTGIIEWFIHENKILAFIFTSKGKITVWQSQRQDLKTYYDWVNKYLQDYNNQKDQWRNNLGKELKKLASFLHIDEILRQIPKCCDQLILIPHQGLHLFPLHVLPVTIKDSENSASLLDLFARGVSYAPSCQILQQLQQRKRLDFQSLFAIQNPTKDLDYANLEVDSILNLFSSHQVLPYKQATKATLLQQMPQIKEANCLHFSCHGSFNFESPQDSCLLLAESVDENDELDLSKCLTLSNLFEREFQLDNCRLVILSACETGLIDFTNISDEYIGLPSGFLYAGSTSVVSSLWTVNDFSTAFLMIKFLHNLKAAMADNGNFSVAVELQKAQFWLRDATKEELQAWASELKLTPEQAENIESSLDWFDSDEQPFQNPYWWAAFCTIGK